MAKGLSPSDLDRKCARSFIDKFNQLIKPLSSMCYIHYDGICYLKSESSKIERFAHIDFGDPIKRLFDGALYDTQELAEFRKVYRYSKSSVAIGYEPNPNDVAIYIRTADPDNKDEVIEHKVASLCGNTIDENEREFGRAKVSAEFYKVFNQMVDFYKTRTGMSDNRYSGKLSEDQMEELRNGDMIEVIDNTEGKDIHAYITKEIFPNIKKDDEIYYLTLPNRSVDDDQIAYMVFIEKILNYNGEGNNLWIFSLISVYQSI